LWPKTFEFEANFVKNCDKKLWHFYVIFFLQEIAANAKRRKKKLKEFFNYYFQKK